MEPTNYTRFINTGAIITAALLIVGGTLWYTGVLTFGEPRAPSLERDITFPLDLSEEARTLLAETIESLKGALQENPDNTYAWLDLAIQYRVLNDLGGAIEIWEYLAAKDLESATVYHNLGSVYHYDLKDYARAERYLRKSIEANPGIGLGYLSLHELYRYSYKQDTSAAEDVLLEGTEKVTGPDKINLYTALAAYYLQDKHDVAKAITSHETARAIAVELGEKRAIELIDAELARLRQ